MHPFACRRTLAWPLRLGLLVLFGLGAIGGQPVRGQGLIFSSLEAAPADPGAFSTVSCRIQYEAERNAPWRDVRIRFTPPREWRALATERVISLAPGSERVIPFTVWVPEQARPDSAYDATFVLSEPTEAQIEAIAIRGISVRGRHGLTLIASTPQLQARAGEEIEVSFSAQNDGNESDVVELESESVPDWPVHIESDRIALEPGESRTFFVQMRVPDAIRGGALHVLDLRAISQDSDVAARARVRTEVLERDVEESRFQRLPVEASASVGEIAPGQPRYGVHILASGNIGANASLGLEADLVAGTRARGVDGWQNQSLRGNLSRGPWELTGGDFAVDPTDLVAPAFSGRGAQVGFRSEAGAVRVARVRNREDAHIHSWDVEAQRILPLRFQVHGEVLQRELEIIGRRPRQDRIASGALIWGDRDGLRIAGEIGVSQSADSSGSTAGRATQLSFRAGSSRATLRGRINVGSRDFTGRTGDRDGVVLFGSWSPRQSPFRLWSNLETTDGRAWATGDSTGSRVSRARAGVRWDARQWPGVEISGGRLTDVSTLGSTTVRSSERSDVTLATTFARGPALLVGTLDHGLVHDRLTGSSGGVRSLELNAGTRIADFRTALHWSQSTDWSPDARSAIESHGWQADLSYYAGSGLVDAGVSLSRRTQLSGTLTQPPALLRIEPRLDVRIAQRWTLRLDASIERVDGDARVNRWQLSVHRSAIELLPVPWVPLRGGVRGVVFIDADGDGRPGPTEERIEDILIRADGRYQTTDRHGEFSWSSLDPGTYWLEVDRGSIPAGMALSVGLPIEVVIDAGRDQDLWIPLAPCGTVRGSLFLDENRDGRIGDEEPGVSDLRIALWRGDDQVAVAMTDTDGGFQLRQVPAGRYELRIDPQWIPRGWEPTTREVWVDVTEDSPTTVAPYGIAPRRKPVVITYPGRGATERP